MILPSNYDEIDFDALYKAQKARSSFGKKFAAISLQPFKNISRGVMIFLLNLSFKFRRFAR